MASKRGNGEGSITRYNKQLWWARITVQTVDGPKRKAFYGKTRSEVAGKMNQALADYNGVVLESEEVTLEQYLKRWLESAVKPSVKLSTYESYEYIVRRHLVPTLGGKKLRKLTSSEVEVLYRQKLESGLSRRTVQLIHTTLHRALEQAVKRRLLAHNVTKAVDAPKPDKADKKYLTPEQVKVFLEAAKGEELEALFVLAVTAGLREGELLGLRWQDVDLSTGTLQVRQQLTRTRGAMSFTKPKNGRGRNVKLMDVAIQALLKHREANYKSSPGNESHVDLVFTTSAGTPLDVANLTYRSFRPLLARADLPQIRFHDLRHTCATLFLSRGTHPKIVQEILGHSTISVTMDTYSHVLPNMQGDAVTAMEKFLL